MRSRTFAWTNPLTQLRSEMDRLFGRLADDATTCATRFSTAREFPAVNMWMNEDAVFVEAEIPGVAHESLDISIHGEHLTLQGERKSATEEGTTFHRRERGMGTFSRRIELPSEINPDAIEANLENGVLTIKLPKAEAAKPHKIVVSGS